MLAEILLEFGWRLAGIWRLGVPLAWQDAGFEILVPEAKK